MKGDIYRIALSQANWTCRPDRPSNASRRDANWKGRARAQMRCTCWCRAAGRENPSRGWWSKTSTGACWHWSRTPQFTWTSWADGAHRRKLQRFRCGTLISIQSGEITLNVYEASHLIFQPRYWRNSRLSSFRCRASPGKPVADQTVSLQYSLTSGEVNDRRAKFCRQSW